MSLDKRQMPRATMQSLPSAGPDVAPMAKFAKLFVGQSATGTSQADSSIGNEALAGPRAPQPASQDGGHVTSSSDHEPGEEEMVEASGMEHADEEMKPAEEMTDDLQKCSVKELRAACMKLTLPVGGRKQDLIARLVQLAQSQRCAHVDVPATSPVLCDVQEASTIAAVTSAHVEAGIESGVHAGHDVEQAKHDDDADDVWSSLFGPEVGCPKRAEHDRVDQRELEASSVEQCEPAASVEDVLGVILNESGITGDEGETTEHATNTAVPRPADIVSTQRASTTTSGVDPADFASFMSAFKALDTVPMQSPAHIGQTWHNSMHMASTYGYKRWTYCMV